MEDRSSLALHVPGCGLFLDCVISFPSDHAALSLYKSDCSLIIAQSAINNFLVQIQTYQDWIKSLACHEMCIFHRQCLEFAHFFHLSCFRAIFSVLDLMKVDMANFALSSIRPHLMQQSVEYERNKFQEFLEKQPSKGALLALNITYDYFNFKFL